MRAVDYLYTLPEVDKRQIGLAGHSRNGKQALLAAAFDERIGAVVPSSGNTGECDPWRYTTDMFANESIELLTGVQSHWFRPRLRFFAGREDKLPVDQNSLMALVRPARADDVLGYAESAGNPFGFEQAYRSALSRLPVSWDATEHLAAPAGRRARNYGRRRRELHRLLRCRLRTRAQPKDRNLDPSATHSTTGGSCRARPSTPAPTVSRFNPARYRGRTPETDRVGARRRTGRASSGCSVAKLPRRHWSGWLAGLFKRPGADAGTRARLTKEGMGWAEIPFGDDLKADLFYPADKPQGKWPVVIWLHPYAYQNGWSALRRGCRPARTTAWSSALVSGDREARLRGAGVRSDRFRRAGTGRAGLLPRYPKWSLMGKMVADTRAGDRCAGRARRGGRLTHLAHGLFAGAKVGC